MRKLLFVIAAIVTMCSLFFSCSNTGETEQIRLGAMGAQRQAASPGEDNLYEWNALTPYEALNYMMETENLYIIDLGPRYEYEIDHFIGAVNHDPEKILEWIDSVPEDRPVLVHDRIGNTSAFVYQTIITERPEIEVVYYIPGYPFIYLYNTWLEDGII